MNENENGNGNGHKGEEPDVSTKYDHIEDRTWGKEDEEGNLFLTDSINVQEDVSNEDDDDQSDARN